MQTNKKVSSDKWVLNNYNANSLISEIDELILKNLNIWPKPDNYDFACYFQSSNEPDNLNLSALIIPENDIGLYIHLPFCSSKCSYCYFKTFKSNSNMIEEYKYYLLKEILMCKDIFSNKNISSVYIGGGTPNYSVNLLLSVIQIITESFNISDKCEITIEIAPEGNAREFLYELKNFNVNRISIGVQALDDNILIQMNRRHNSKQAIHWINSCLESDIKNLNVDIIPGFPNFTPEKLKNTLIILSNLAVPSITLYDFETRKYIPLYKFNSPKFRSSKQVLWERAFSREILGALGYEEYLVSWFRKNNDIKFFQQECKWKSKPYIGLGISAYGFAGDYILSHESTLLDYYKSVENKNSIKGARLTYMESLGRLLYFGIRLPEGIKINRQNYSGTNILKLIDILLKHNFLELTHNNSIRLSNKGILVSDEIAELIEYNSHLLEDYNFVLNTKLHNCNSVSL